MQQQGTRQAPDDPVRDTRARHTPPPSSFFPVGKPQAGQGLTLTFRLSAVVSSNASPSLKEISVLLSEVSVLTCTRPAAALMLILGFSAAARCRSPAGTPGGRESGAVLGRWGSPHRPWGKPVRNNRGVGVVDKVRSLLQGTW